MEKIKSLLVWCLMAGMSVPALGQQERVELKAPGGQARNGEVKALYMRPQGTYLFGLGLSTSQTRGYFVPAYTPMAFRNLSENAVAYNWTSEGSDGTEYIRSTETEPVITLPLVTIPTPTLTARGADNSRVSYRYGKISEDDTKDGEITAGHWNEAINVNRVDFGVGTLTMPGDATDYVFGTSKRLDVYSISNYFEKPLQQCVVRSAYITFGAGCLQMDTVALKASGNTQLTLRAVQVERNGNQIVRKDTLATAISDVFDIMDLTFTTGFQCYYLSFRFPEPLVVNTEVLYELGGFYGNEALAFGIQSNRSTDIYEENAFVQVRDGDGSLRLLPSSEYTKELTNGSTAFRASLMFGLDMLFPVFHTEQSHVDCDVEGGTVSIDFETSYAENTPNPEDTYPVSFSVTEDWLTIENVTYEEFYHGRTVEISYEALPADVASRTAKLVVKAFGMPDQEIVLAQGSNSGISGPQQLAEVHVGYETDAWTVVCPEGCRGAKLLDSAGRVVERCLPKGNGFRIGHDGLPSGMYLFLLEFEDGCRVVKAVK